MCSYVQPASRIIRDIKKATYICVHMHIQYVSVHRLFVITGIRQFLYHDLKEDARVFVGVSGVNSLDWIISDIAVSLQSMVLVPIHTSLVSSLLYNNT